MLWKEREEIPQLQEEINYKARSLESFTFGGRTDMKCFSSKGLVCIFSVPKKSKLEPMEVGIGQIPIQLVQHFSMEELKMATQGFRSSNKIGDGGFGSVYMGKLRDGSLVAVKVLSAESTQGDREFLAEIAALSHVCHHNLVKLRGCCIQGSSRILVYEYMPCNSLSQTLFGRDRGGGKFGWAVRRRIAFGVACGLAYLHDEIRPHVVHRDIKASNILLDRDLTAKISDFGLAKLFTDNITHLSTRVAGTIGYLAPEYALSGQVTRKSDVYSFGVLLMEIISGRSVADFAAEFFEQPMVMHAWELYQAEQLEQLVDAALEGERGEAVHFLKVALLCVQQTPQLRPLMPKVVKMLSADIDITDVVISQPGIIMDYTDLKIGQKTSGIGFNSYSSRSTSSSSSSSFPS